MPKRELKPEQLASDEDWHGNNAGFCCPVCGKVFLVSALLDKKGRSCPACGKSTGYVRGGSKSGGTAHIEW
ncbi:MAG: hypothetical protein IH851_12635 [Armatimonadetes bacterium]|nr:hypothetical protein [Armatimonadota bacterium]